MMPNYEEQYQRQEQDYRRSRNPFEYGQQVARRRYSEIMAGLDAQRRSTQRSYGDMYQEARQRAVRNQAAGGPSLSGGMGQQRRDYVSAMEMQELGKIGGAQQQAMADLYTQQQAAFSNAQLEGQQAAQMDLQNRTSALQLEQEKVRIINSGATAEQKKAQLEALGADTSGIELKDGGFDWTLGWGKVIDGEADASDLIGTLVATAGVAIAVAYAAPLLLKGAGFIWKKTGLVAAFSKLGDWFNSLIIPSFTIGG
jgi:hypothetical protein